ncbi:MAG TPA: multicopper oxidase domain-containing protein [Longimicrobiales bacterium]|nr:multicopper oxidase domain-containing protein [Longimicrobiales bacterium]
MDRRTFLGLAGAGAALGLPGDLGAIATPALRQAGRHPLVRPGSLSGERLTLTAAASRANVGPGTVDAWSLNGSVPSPTIRMRRGGTARIDLVNRLPEPTILHWHGLAVPYQADGHPRWAIDTGETYSYEFRVVNRAGTYWYHPHTHLLTASQTYKGMGGLFIVEDEEEEGYGLPRDELEIPLILQDKRLGAELSLSYQLGMGPDMMMGFLGDTPFANGVANPTADVRRARYRLRILNASNARIFDLAMSAGDSLTLIGSDGGLLGAPVRAERIMLAPAERADVIVDFAALRPGTRVMLRSKAFQIPGMMMGMGMGGGGGGRMGRGMGRGGGMMGGAGGVPQGTEMDLVEFVVQEGRPDTGPPLPGRFAAVPDRGEVGSDTPRRTFRFDSVMMSHTINGRTFEMDGVHERIRLHRTEVWTFVNESELPHPVHVHADLFRVLARRGGRNRVMPWESGLKDTVLVLPGEQVDVAVRFAHPGVFLLHCHNLEHEDMGMMINFEVVE